MEIRNCFCRITALPEDIVLIILEIIARTHRARARRVAVRMQLVCRAARAYIPRVIFEVFEVCWPTRAGHIGGPVRLLLELASCPEHPVRKHMRHIVIHAPVFSNRVNGSQHELLPIEEMAFDPTSARDEWPVDSFGVADDLHLQHLEHALRLRPRSMFIADAWNLDEGRDPRWCTSILAAQQPPDNHLQELRLVASRGSIWRKQWALLRAMHLAERHEPAPETKEPWALAVRLHLSLDLPSTTTVDLPARAIAALVAVTRSQIVLVLDSDGSRHAKPVQTFVDALRLEPRLVADPQARRRVNILVSPQRQRPMDLRDYAAALEAGEDITLPGFPL